MPNIFTATIFQTKWFFFYCYLQTANFFFLQINIFMLYASFKELDKVKCGTITALSNTSFFHCGIYTHPVKYRNSIKRFFPHVKTLSANRGLLSVFPTHVACPLKASVHTPQYLHHNLVNCGLMQFKALLCFNLLLRQWQPMFHSLPSTESESSLPAQV